MFILRFLSSVAWLAFSYAVIYLFPLWVFRLVVTALVGLGLFEFYSLAEKKGFRVGKYFATAMGVLVPLLAYQQDLTPKTLAAYPFFSVLFFLVFFGYQFAKGKNEGSLAGLSVTVAGIVYVSVLFSFLIPLRIEASHWVAYLLLVTKGGDIGAYVVGSAVGRHPLTPRVSPNKTIEGSIAGIFTSVVVSLFAFQFLLRGHLPFAVGEAFLWVAFASLGLLLGIVGLLGDLAESLIKRDCQTKDAREFIPGMGGILDVIDSLLFTTPLFYAVVRFFR
ncbi:MAG: CDP-archaeol synthase [Candidatus Omnitrophica bacterium]|nr:CDP-archaeol synthase [Candidatus Omnitrophota bacterium]